MQKLYHMHKKVQALLRKRHIFSIQLDCKLKFHPHVEFNLTNFPSLNSGI